MNTKTALLDAALQRFASFGYDGSSVQEICDDCGLTKPTLYHYFGSKRGLLEALLAREYLPLWPALEDACNYRQDLTLSLEAVLRAYFHYASQSPLFYRLQLWLRYAPHQSDACMASRPYLQKQEEMLAGLFEAAAAQHGNMRGRQQAYALSLLGMLNAYISHAQDQQGRLDEAAVQAARQQFMYGIFS